MVLELSGKGEGVVGQTLVNVVHIMYLWLLSLRDIITNIYFSVMYHSALKIIQKKSLLQDLHLLCNLCFSDENVL
jgi:hypothetical protein